MFKLVSWIRRSTSSTWWIMFQYIVDSKWVLTRWSSVDDIWHTCGIQWYLSLYQKYCLEISDGISSVHCSPDMSYCVGEHVNIRQRECQRQVRPILIRELRAPYKTQYGHIRRKLFPNLKVSFPISFFKLAPNIWLPSLSWKRQVNSTPWTRFTKGSWA